MAWLLPLMRQLRDSEKLKAVSLVDNINTEEAWALLHEWADSDDEALARQAKWQFQRGATDNAASISLAFDKGRDLIAGRIKPDDLLEPPVPYIWTDAGYVPETAAKGGD